MGARFFSFMVVLVVALQAALPVRAGEPGSHYPGYTVSRTADGIELTVHFGHRAYPKHALVAVTATVHNLSHQHLAVAHGSLPYGLCSRPVVSIVSVDATGKDVPRPMPIPPPSAKCAAPPHHNLPVGESFVEDQLVVLWTPQLRVTAELYNVENNSYSGFQFQGPTARFAVHGAPAPTISVKSGVASVSPPKGAHGAFYYQSWGHCADGRGIAVVPYWTERRDRHVSSGCDHVRQWHLDVAWLNSPIASLNLGAGHS